MSTIAEIAQKRWEWRARIMRLALFEMRNEGRGAALSWGWFFIQPAIYIACFWFAIGLGLRGGGAVEAGMPPYILWLSAGIIPWMFMRDILSKGSKAFNLRPSMVNTMVIPLPCITSIFSISFIFVQAMLLVLLFGIALACGQTPSIFLLQLPIVILLMIVFWDTVALMLSILSAISKDFSRLINVVSTPLFWISGVIFNISNFPVEWVKGLFYLNPITFFVNAYRDTFYYQRWFFSDWQGCLGFAVVFIVTLTVTALLYRKFGRVIPDVV